MKDVTVGHRYYWKRDTSIVNIVEQAPNIGCSLFDTSSAYGQSERVLGHCLKKYPRSDFFLITKLSNQEQREGDVRKALFRSLKHLNTDSVDLYLMHWPQTGTFLDCWKQMEQLYKEGYAKSIGVCNFKEHHFEELMQVAEIKPMVCQIESHPLFPQNDMLMYCKKNNIQMMAYTPTGRMDVRIRENEALRIISRKNQKNIAEIAKENAKEGTDFSEKSGVSEEWFDRFMESASYVSSEEMQLVWGKILANEFEQPGCTPRNMTRILSEFTQDYAKAFRTLCSMRVLLISVNGDEKIVSANRRNAVVFDQNEEYMRKIGLSFALLNELETLGVIKFDTVVGYVATDMNEKKVLVYINGNVIETSSHIDETFPIGNVLFTSAGEALSKITEPYTLEGYEDAVIKYLKSNNVTVETESLYNVVVFGDRIHVDKKKQ